MLRNARAHSCASRKRDDCKVGATVKRRAYLDSTCLRRSDPEGSSSRQNWFDGYRDRVSSYFVGRLVFGRVSARTTGIKQRSSPASPLLPLLPLPMSSLPAALTRTFVVHIDAGHHCYKCCSSHRHSRCSFADRSTVIAEKRVVSRKQVFFFKGLLARILMKLICVI